MFKSAITYTLSIACLLFLFQNCSGNITASTAPVFELPFNYVEPHELPESSEQSSRYLIFSSATTSASMEKVSLGYYELISDGSVVKRSITFSSEENFQVRDRYTILADKYSPIALRDTSNNPITLSEFRGTDRIQCDYYATAQRFNVYSENRCPGNVGVYKDLIYSDKWVSKTGGQWTLEGDDFNIQIDGEKETWVLESSNLEFFVKSDTASLASAKNVAGFAYLSDTISTVLDPSHLGPNNLSKGQFLFNNNNAPTSSWRSVSRSLSLAAYTKTGAAKMEFSHLDRSIPSCPLMHVHHALFFRRVEESKQILLRFDGQDKNYNGCFDEGTYRKGHQQMTFVAVNHGESQLSRMVYIEFGTEADGYPIMGVGFVQ